jgi:hypothetical protein
MERWLQTATPKEAKRKKKKCKTDDDDTTADSEGSAPTGGERTTRDTLSASRAA